MKKSIILLLTILSLIFISCTNTNFSEDLKNFEACSANVEPIGDCIEDKYGYEFNTATDTCSQVIVQGCAVQTPFESLEECQAACFTSEQDKDNSIKTKIDEKIQKREESKNE
jgi:hypothetical protein